MSHHGLRGDGQSVIVPWHTPKESVQTIGSPTVRTFARMACEGFMSCACFRRDEEMAAPTWLGVLLIIAYGLAGERTLRKNIINRDGFRAYDLSAFRMICGAYAREAYEAGLSSVRIVPIRVCMGLHRVSFVTHGAFPCLSCVMRDACVNGGTCSLLPSASTCGRAEDMEIPQLVS